MKYVICSIRDAKAEIFGTPFYARSNGEAIRSFEDEVNRAAENNALFKHPHDFSLYRIGYFEDSDATVETDVPQLLVMGDQVVADKFKVSKV